MALFLIRERESNPKIFRLSGQLVFIGRAEASDLVLPNTAVGRRHARLQREGGGWLLEDLGSPNGTTVNDQPHNRGPLAHGDVVRIVRYRLEYLEEDKLDAAQKKSIRNLHEQGRAPLSDRDTTFAMTPAMRQKILAAEKARDGLVLAATDGSDRSWRPEGRPLHIGPGGEVPSRQVFRSSPVAVLEWKGTDYSIRRLGFWGTLMVNGQTVKESPVKPGDKVQVGKDVFEVRNSEF